MVKLHHCGVLAFSFEGRRRLFGMFMVVSSFQLQIF